MGLKMGICKEYRTKHPDMPSLKLARIIYAKNGAVFTSIENVRSSLRYIEGKNGVSNRKKVIGTSFIKNEDRSNNPYQLPKSWSEPTKIFKLPLACNRVGVIADAQVPFHDEIALKSAVKWLKEKNANTIFINGDWSDFYGISDYIKDPRQRNFKQELEDCRISLKWLRGEFPNAIIYYNLNSNHELRFQKFLMQKAKELYDIDDWLIENVLKLHESNIIPLKEYSHTMIGKLPILHGHTIFGRYSNSVSKAKTLFDKLKHSAMCSHVHITDEHNSKDLDGKIFTTWTTGCLMSLNVEYNPHSNQYNHGIAFVTTETNGDYSVENKRIYNGKIL